MNRASTLITELELLASKAKKELQKEQEGAASAIEILQDQLAETQAKLEEVRQAPDKPSPFYVVRDEKRVYLRDGDIVNPDEDVLFEKRGHIRLPLLAGKEGDLGGYWNKADGTLGHNKIHESDLGPGVRSLAVEYPEGTEKITLLFPSKLLFGDYASTGKDGATAFFADWGDDRNPGTRDKPCKTAEGAMSKTRTNGITQLFRKEEDFKRYMKID